MKRISIDSSAEQPTCQPLRDVYSVLVSLPPAVWGHSEDDKDEACRVWGGLEESEHPIDVFLGELDKWFCFSEFRATKPPVGHHISSFVR